MNNDIAKRSREHFESGFYCAESVLLAVAESRGIKSDLIPKMATGFCSGLSRTCGICGALSGAIMALNMVHGRSKPDDSVDELYSRVQKLIDTFEGKFGSTNCKELTGCDLGTKQGQEAFYAKNIKEKCFNYTEEAARMVVSII